MPRRADVTENVATANVLSRDDRETRKMSIQGFDSVAMIDNDLASVSCAHAGLENGSVSGCANRVALVGGDVDPGMKCPFTIEGIQTGAEGAGDDALHRP